MSIDRIRLTFVKGFVTLGVLVLAGGVARAAQNPPGCMSNDFVLNLAKDKSNVHVGDVVTYTVRTGNPNTSGSGCDVDVSSISVKTPDGTVHPLNLGPGAGNSGAYPTGTATAVLGTVTYTASAADQTGNGSLIASATTAGKLHDNPILDDPLAITKSVSSLLVIPCIAVTKACTDAPAPGQPIQFSGTVTNCGAVSQDNLVNVTVVDDHAGTVLTLGSLAAGASAPYSGSYVPSSSPSTDTVTASGTDVLGLTVTKTASATCKILTAPGISVTKACTDAPAPRQPITFSGTVTNTGNVDLNNVTCVDDKSGTVLTLASLAAGASAPYSGSYVPVSGPSTDTVTCTGTDAINGGTVSNNGSATCTVCAEVKLGDFIWNDTNHNGIQNKELGIPGVVVNILDCSGNVIATTTTDANGFYLYTAKVCDPNSVNVAISVDTNQAALAGYTHTLVGQGPEDLDSDCGKGADANTSQCTTLTVSNPFNLNRDCGFFKPPTCDLTVDKQVCSIAQVGQGCTSGAQAITIEYTGADATPSSLTVKGSNGRTVRYDFSGSLVSGVALTCPPQAGAPYTCVGINPALNPGNENGFTIDATASGCATCKLGSTVSVFVNGSSTAQEIFHTSCSCTGNPSVNLVVGAAMCLDANSPDNTAGVKGTPSPLWRLVALRDPTLGVIGEPDPSLCEQNFVLPQAPCSIKDNKLTELTFEYVGAQTAANNCANQQNSQAAGDRPCKGTADDTQPIALTVTDGAGGETFLNRPPSGAYMLGDTFTVRSIDAVHTGDGKADPKPRFPGDMRIKAFAPSNLTKAIEDQKFKSDCSKAINIGDVFGGFKVIGITSTKGGTYKQCIDVEYRYTVANNDQVNASAPVWVCDDKVAAVCQVTRAACTSDADCDVAINPSDTCGPIAGNVAIGAGAVVHYTALPCVAPETANTVVVQTQACPAVPSGDPAFCAIAGTALPPPPPPTPGPCQKPLRLRLQYTGQQIGTCDSVNDVSIKVTASSGPSATLLVDCLKPGDIPVGPTGWTLDGGTTVLATVVTVEVLDNGTPPTVCSGGNITGTNLCTTIAQCEVGGALDHEIFASTNVPITKGCVEDTEKFHTSCSCTGNPDVNLVIGHQMCLDASSGTNDSGLKGEPSHLWKLAAREPL